MNRIRNCLTAVSSIALLSFTLPAMAEKDPKTAAKEQFALAHKKFRRKRYNDAIKLFEKARRLWDHPSIQYNIALSHALMGNYVEAVFHLRQYLKRTKGKETKLPTALLMARMRASVLVVQVAHPTAEIYIDGKPVGKKRVEQVLVPGKRAVDIRIKDRVVASKTIDLEPGKETAWEVATIIVTPPQPRQPAPEQGARPESPRPAPASKARLTTRAVPQPDLTLKPATPTLKIPKGMYHSPTRLHWAWFALAATLTAACTATAVITSVRAKQLHDDYMEDRTKSSLKDKGRMFEKITNAFWGISGGLATATVVLAIFTRWKKKARESPISITPWVGPTAGGLSVEWQH